VIRPRAIVLRLIVALALMLFGAPHIHTDRTLAHAAPVAESIVGQTKAALSVQRHLLRAQFPDGDTPDMEAPGTADRNWQVLAAPTISPAPQPSFLAIAFRILPPVRGPPVA